MKRVYVVIPSGHSVGLTSVSLGLVRALEQTNHRVAFLKPISQPDASDPTSDHSAQLVKKLSNLDSPNPIDLVVAEHLLSTGQEQVLMEQVDDLFQKVAGDVDVVVVEGMVSSHEVFFAKRLNALMVDALGGEVIVVAAPNGKDPNALAESVSIQVREFGSDFKTKVAGCIINKIGCSESCGQSETSIEHAKLKFFGGSHDKSEFITKCTTKYREAVEKADIEVIGTIPLDNELSSPRVLDLAKVISAHGLRQGDWQVRRVKNIALCTMTLQKGLNYFQEGTLVITTGDRADIILGAAMAELNGIKLAGVVICGGFEPDANVLMLCERAFESGLPLLSASTDVFRTASVISTANIEIPIDDIEKGQAIMDTLANYINNDWLISALGEEREHRTSPPAFRNHITKLARKAGKRIVLPEGDEPRTIKAAILSAERGIATPVLLAKREVVEEIAKEQDLTITNNIEIIDPDEIKSNYVKDLMEIRKKKGLTEEQAIELLSDPIYVGTMMLHKNEVDGLVSGAVHTTANTIRPAMQIIKTQPGASLVSSVFFMCLPDQVLVYGDCAINLDPDADQLAQIAIQSAESAKAFKIPTRVAMISYSTGSSGQGADVEKVRAATEKVKELKPDIVIDGPLQYDAAVTKSVAKSKAPNSPVAGQATVAVFPDLNTGNTTYKAVQRSADVVSIGPMLQGLDKPVNDLSRGALVEDIIYTIALTSIQAVQCEQRHNK